MAVYKGIAPGENRKSLPSMDVGSRKLGNGLVQLAFSLDDQVTTTYSTCFLSRADFPNVLFVTFEIVTHRSHADHLQE